MGAKLGTWSKDNLGTQHPQDLAFSERSTGSSSRVTPAEIMLEFVPEWKVMHRNAHEVTGHYE